MSDEDIGNLLLHILIFISGMIAGAHVIILFWTRSLRKEEKMLREIDVRKPTPRHVVISTDDQPPPHKGFFWYDDEGESHRSDTHPNTDPHAYDDVRQGEMMF